MEKTEKENKIRKLEKELAEMREFHADAWAMYGSELCSNEMIEKERALEQKISGLKNEEA